MQTFNFWHLPIDQIFTHFKSQKEGLTSQEAQRRLNSYGLNSLKPPARGKGITLFISQFKSPLILLLIGAALLSFFLGGYTDTLIIFSIVFLSGLLGFFQERGALNTLEKLMQLVENKATVLRDGKETEIPIEKVVPGDIVILKAGDLIPADCILFEAKYFFVDEATLTGESIPVEKVPGAMPLETANLKRSNALFLGTMVSSGMGTAIVCSTGVATEYSHIAERVRFRPPKTAFELGVREFSNFLLEVTLVLVIVIFAFNIYFHRPIVDSFLFSLALAVGLTPQLLPAIISVNLAHGARRMAQKHVIIKRLASIENFGQMDVLCADKSGTLTQGKVRLEQAVCIDGKVSEKVALFGFLNSYFQAGYANPLDQAILQAQKFDVAHFKKVDEMPYDFIRKRLSVVLENRGESPVLITKGAFPQVLSVCNRVELEGGTVAPLSKYKEQIENYFTEQAALGFKIIALAYGTTREEKELIFLGFLQFFDPIKPEIAETVTELQRRGVTLKIITGDHHSVAMHAARHLGVTHASYITGTELHQISDHALLKVIREKNVFAEIEPNQKERIILALRKSGHVVGFLGDGINDVSALHSADVGISVDSGADAAKEVADIVLLEKDLTVLIEGIDEGRRTFSNTLKYVYMATSANFGNMFSMACASLFLNFLPLLPKQVLLTNFLSDFPEMALATDRVDADILRRPAKWDIAFIRRFMLVFGLLNALADFLTFAVLLFYFKADSGLFRTGWFIENVVTAALVALVIRTRGPFWRSMPGKLLIFAVFTVIILVNYIPFTSFGTLFGFTQLPITFYLFLIAIVTFYIFSVEVAKHFFFRKKATGNHASPTALTEEK